MTQTDIGFEREIELVKRLPSKRQNRFYRLAIWPDLFGGYSLAREYGRIGQGGTLRLDPYPEEKHALAALVKLMKSKRRRGYMISALPPKVN
ncbi:MAG: hypothetical protein ETSY1_23445 [Candidatus Entotheonella factor]|uniref:WGR domain-containing protein n=1 Tax=Entotheonella factor TaxID=1429438 RepID=W4LGM2_ENTF1|nr:MAG: hypothetical protein ETSY1_23445 [Candidatus Entotheonella factor]